MHRDYFWKYLTQPRLFSCCPACKELLYFPNLIQQSWKILIDSNISKCIILAYNVYVLYNTFMSYLLLGIVNPPTPAKLNKY